MTSWNGSNYHRSLNFLIDYLEQIPSLRDPNSRRLCLGLLADRGVRLVVDDLPTTRAHLIGIVQACRKHHPHALTAFIDAVETLEPGSIPVKQARAVVADMTALDLLAERDRRQLLDLLGVNPIEQLATFVRSAAGPAVDLTLDMRYPIEAVVALERMNARPDGIPPLLVFVERLAAYFGDTRAEQLRSWNDREASRLGLAEKLLTLRLERPVEPPRPQDVVAYLVVRIEPDHLDPELFTLTYWRQYDPEWRPQRGESFGGDLEAIRRHVAGLIADAETDWAKNAKDIRLEFLLPYALVNLPVDQWDLETGGAHPHPIGLYYQVVLRSLDRARSPRWHREWRHRWELLKQLEAGMPTPVEYWLSGVGTKPRHLTALDATLAARKEVVSLVLSSVPEGAERGELMIGVRAGVPVIIWHRADSARSAFEAQVKALRETLPELVENLRLLRAKAKKASRPNAHVGSRISLLWDDPDRPVEPLDPPAAPIEEVPAR